MSPGPPASGFDRLAPFYRWMETIAAGRLLQQCREAFLDEIPQPAAILILGEGNGRSLSACLRRFPRSTVVCVEQSGGMIRQAREHLRRLGLPVDHVTFVQADVLEWAYPHAAFDLVVSHFFLDCLTVDQLGVLIPRVAAATTPDARWLVADFHIPAKGWRRMRSRLILWLLYRFFRITTGLPAGSLADPAPLLAASGFTLEKHREANQGLLKSECWVRG